jgi:hypothetical protein
MTEYLSSSFLLFENVLLTLFLTVLFFLTETVPTVGKFEILPTVVKFFPPTVLIFLTGVASSTVF